MNEHTKRDAIRGPGDGKKPKEIHVPIWKQRLFELGIVVVLVLMIFDMFWDSAPFLLELMFVGLAVLSAIFGSWKNYCAVRMSRDELKIMSPALFGRGFAFDRNEIDHIEESNDLFKTWTVHLRNGKHEEVVLRRVLGVTYSSAINEMFRKMIRNSGIRYSGTPRAE